MLSKHTRTKLITVNGKKVRESRWLVEQKIGRKLLRNEHVHHINNNPLDNRLDNLKVIDSHQHMILHKQKYPAIKICEVCGNSFKPIVQKRKSQKCCGKKCAHILRVKNMTKTRYGHIPDL